MTASQIGDASTKESKGFFKLRANIAFMGEINPTLGRGSCSKHSHNTHLPLVLQNSYHCNLKHMVLPHP